MAMHVCQTIKALSCVAFASSCVKVSQIIRGLCQVAFVYGEGACARSCKKDMCSKARAAAQSSPAECL